jgi:hypothetical protein
MARFFFFLLLVANAAFGAHVWMTQQKPLPPLPPEIEPQSLRVVGVVDATAAAREMEVFATQQKALAAGPCVELAGLGVSGAPRARELLGALDLGSRVAERRIEEVTKYAVYIPPLANKRAIDEAIAQLKAKKVTDYQVLGDNSVSIGTFGSEDAANRHLADMTKRGIKNAKIAGRNRELRDVIFIVNQPDADLAGRLLMVARDLPGAKLQAAACIGPTA